MKNELNVELIERTAQWIEDHPNHYDQTTWGTRHENEDYPEDSEEFFYDVVLSCGTPCCVAGHFVALGSYKDGIPLPAHPRWPREASSLPGPSHLLTTIAINLAGLSQFEADRLFWGMWPEEWVQEDKGPLTLPDHGIGVHHFYPASKDAIRVLRRLAKYGFQEK